jgi:hypothetical protein
MNFRDGCAGSNWIGLKEREFYSRFVSAVPCIVKTKNSAYTLSWILVFALQNYESSKFIFY